MSMTAAIAASFATSFEQQISTPATISIPEAWGKWMALDVSCSLSGLGSYFLSKTPEPRLAMQKSETEKEMMLSAIDKIRSLPPNKQPLKAQQEQLVRSNSCSSMCVKSSVWLPDSNELMAGMSLVLMAMLETPPDSNNQANGVLDPFNPRRLKAHTPDTGLEMHRFLAACYELGRWSPESNVIAMVLVTRFRSASGVSFNRNNWPMVILIAMNLAQKSWDDVPLTNVDFPQLLEIASHKTTMFKGYKCSWREVNRMEMEFIKVLNWNIHVTNKTYMTFHYELQETANVTTSHRSKPTRQEQVTTEHHLAKLEAKEYQAPSAQVLRIPGRVPRPLSTPLGCSRKLRHMTGGRAVLS
jgi:hypothetical protein